MAATRQRQKKFYTVHHMRMLLSFIAADRFNGLSVDLRSAPNLAMFVSLLKDVIGYPKKEGHRACGVSLLK